jgi:flagellar hook assembly protein FlgD
LETVAINNLAYNFVGDPMVPMRQPGGKVAVAKVDGKEVEDSQLKFEPLSTHTFEGYIYTEDGAVDTSFNGEVTMAIYDGNHTVSSTDKNDSANPVLDVNIDGTLLQEVKFAVVNGQFSGSVTFANPSYIGTYNRVTMFAITTDMDRSSVGVLNNVLIDRSSSFSVSESTAPVITAMYAGDEDFIENDQVPGSFTLYATVEAGELSLLGRSDRIGGSVSLTLDDSKNLVGVDGYLTLNADGSASLEYPVTELSDGLHTLTLRITNVGGVSAERSLNVTVVNTADAEVVVNGIARTEAVINVENHTTSDEPAGRLVIYDPAGKVVFTKDAASFPYTWNLKDAEDKAVADGVYTAKVYFKAGRHYGCATPASIVVAR